MAGLGKAMHKGGVDVVIVGAGPYGLSLAAYLRDSGVRFRIFGTPMATWRERMPAGTFLKSDGFASSLYEPSGQFTLEAYCWERGIPYEAIGMPVPVEIFVEYGLEFQRRFVPGLEQVDVVGVKEAVDGFEVETATGETVRSKRVVMAVGITHFDSKPEALEGLRSARVTHSSEHARLDIFRGRRVAVLGAGASAVDLAGLLQDAGAQVELIARRPAIAFHEPTVEPRPVWDRIKRPRSGLGLGWKSRFCSEMPLLFHAMPTEVRLRAVKRHLGPAPGWFARQKFEGRVQTHLRAHVERAEDRGNGVALTMRVAEGAATELVVDHLIAATGYRVEVGRLWFLTDAIRSKLRCVEGSPVLSREFESSVPGLYFVGLASANSFGPLARFACGAEFTSRRLATALTTAVRRGAKRRQPEMATAPGA